MRLDKLVTVIASNMVAEVCSIYLRRAGKVLELFATEGLNRAAVHTTRLKEGEGLVGMVSETAEAVNLSRRAFRPAFLLSPGNRRRPVQELPGRAHCARRPGVRRAGGAEQGRARSMPRRKSRRCRPSPWCWPKWWRRAASSISPNWTSRNSAIDRPRKFMGDGLSEGVAIGHVVLHEPRVKVDRMIADNPVEELKRLEDAISTLRESVDQMLVSSELDLTGEGREVIEAYRLFAYDQGWRQRMRDAVRTGLTAEAAVERVQDETRLRVQRLGDPILRERAHDFDDLARRLLRHLTGDERRISICRATRCWWRATWARRNCWIMAATNCWAWRWKTPPPPAMSPSWPARWACRWSPSLEGIADNARAGDAIAVDGETGEVHLRPPPRSSQPSRKSAICASRPRPALPPFAICPPSPGTACAIRLMMNAGLEFDMPHLTESGADGIGLFRTELQFMIGETMPRLADQTAFYKSILDAAGDKPVVFRTLDLGGDKVLPYARWEREENPALGWRAIRIALDRPALLRYQVRALLAAAQGRTLRILLPMVSRRGRVQSRPRPDRPRTGAGAAVEPDPPHPGAGGRDAGSAGAGLHAAATDALGRFRFHRLQ